MRLSYLKIYFMVGCLLFCLSPVKAQLQSPVVTSEVTTDLKEVFDSIDRRRLYPFDFNSLMPTDLEVVTVNKQKKLRVSFFSSECNRYQVVKHLQGYHLMLYSYAPKSSVDLDGKKIVNAGMCSHYKYTLTLSPDEFLAAHSGRQWPGLILSAEQYDVGLENPFSNAKSPADLWFKPQQMRDQIVISIFPEQTQMSNSPQGAFQIELHDTRGTEEFYLVKTIDGIIFNAE